MDQDDYRFSMSADKYLEHHHITVYLHDAVTQLLQHKDDNPKVNTTKFFSDYFTSVKEGNHVIFREFSFVSATPHNRASFVRTFWKCFRNIGKKGDLLSVHEYHSLMCLLCSDFPLSIAQKTARIILMDDALDCLISFPDFLYAFQLQFCFKEFLDKCNATYKEMEHKHASGSETVVVPTSEDNPASSHPAEVKVESGDSAKSEGNEGVDAMHFFRALIPSAEKKSFDSPPLTVLRQILSSQDRVTFYGFLMALAKSEELNTSIGKLPAKASIFDTTDQELTTDPDSLVVMTTTNSNADSTHFCASTNHVPPIRPGSAAKLRQNSAQNSRSEKNTTKSDHIPKSTTSTQHLTSAFENPSENASRTNSLTSKPPPRRSRPLTGKKQATYKRISTSSDDDDDDDDSDSTY